MRLLGAARFQCSALPSVFFLERGPSSFKIINERLLSYFSHGDQPSTRKNRARRATDGHFVRLPLPNGGANTRYPLAEPFGAGSVTISSLKQVCDVLPDIF